MRFLMFFTPLLLLQIPTCKVKQVSSDSEPVSHAIWEELLQAHVTEDGWVDYQAFLQDTSRLSRYLDLLRSHHPNDAHWTQKEQLAYWLNAYNAFTVDLVLRHYPVASIRHIKKGIPLINSVWDIKCIEIEGKTYDLNNLEHGIIRPVFEDPRIHFALNCASVSCPVLQPFAFTAEDLDNQLDAATRQFLADGSRNQFHSREKAELSRIFKWYSGDFKASGGVRAFVNQYGPMKLNEDVKIDYLEYDWGLNDVMGQNVE